MVFILNLICKFLIFFYWIVSFLERKVFIKNIGKDDLVLDVGSGDKPFWRADVVVDKYLDDDGQRSSGSMLYHKKKLFVQADVQNLPFKNNAFDFVFCSHVLEHVDYPEKAIAELRRVAKRGYIEVPAPIIDIFQPFPPHLWFCAYRNKTLYFKQKEKEKNFFLETTEFFGKIFFNEMVFQYLLLKHYRSVFIGLYWEGKVNFAVLRSKNAPYVYKQKTVLHGKTIPIKKTFILYGVFYFFVNTFFYKDKHIILENILKEKKR